MLISLKKNSKIVIHTTQTIAGINCFSDNGREQLACKTFVMQTSLSKGIKKLQSKASHFNN
jgi:hypothetical protein